MKIAVLGSYSIQFLVEKLKKVNPNFDVFEGTYLQVEHYFFGDDNSLFDFNPDFIIIHDTTLIADNYDEILRGIHEFEGELDIPILLNFENSIYKDQLFFNQNYHLNKDGRSEYTNNIVSVIKEKNILYNF